MDNNESNHNLHLRFWLSCYFIKWRICQTETNYMSKESFNKATQMSHLVFIWDICSRSLHLTKRIYSFILDAGGVSPVQKVQYRLIEVITYDVPGNVVPNMDKIMFTE